MKMNRSDNYIDLIAEELWKIQNPDVKITDQEAIRLLKIKILSRIDNDVINKNTKIFLPPKKIYQELVTSRNKKLITQSQQNLLKKTIVAFFGLSVGSHAALTWSMLSRADKIKISDPDFVSPTNLNRLRFGWDTIGELKVDIVKKQLEEINPYIKIYKFSGRSAETVNRIILNKPRPNVIVDSMDDLKSKVFARLLARDFKIPVIMATDVGDNVILDIERFDKLPQPPLFNDRVNNIEKIDLSRLSSQQRIKLSMKIVGFKHNSVEMLESLLSIGKTIRTWPQLGSTATLAGGIVATIIKKIVLGEKIKSGRYNISIDALVVEDYYSKKKICARKNLISQLKSILD